MKLIKLLVLFSFIGLSSCNNYNYDKEMPKDFAFKINSNLGSFDSNNSYYTKLVSSKDTTIKVELKKSEMERIYESIKNIDFMSFPNEIECTSSNATASQKNSFIEITINNKPKKVVYNKNCDENKPSKDLITFNVFEEQIWKVLEEKSMTINMEEIDLEKIDFEGLEILVPE